MARSCSTAAGVSFIAALRGARSLDRGLALGAAAGCGGGGGVAAAGVCLGASVGSDCDGAEKMGCDCCANSSRIDGMCERVFGGLVSWTRGIGGSMGWVMEVSGPPALRGGDGGCGLRR